MIRHNIPTAKYQSFEDPEKAKNFIQDAPFNALVVKASGLAAGKGVIVAKNKSEACAAVDEILGDKKFGKAGEIVVIEELLSGEEVSCLAFVDSNTVRMLLPAQDHKRLKDNDEGLNTGGMGAYCPCNLISKSDLRVVEIEVLQRAIDGLRKEGIIYNGILYAGIMLTQDGPKTLEFNCRFGDPETQVILPLLKTDLYDLMMASAENKLDSISQLEFEDNLSAVGVIMASAGYPETSTKGCVIENIDKVSAKPNHLVFHSGTTKNSNNQWTTNGGRVLINVALAKDLRNAAELATKACDIVRFDGSQNRRDIAKKAFRNLAISYKDSGVDIEAGEKLVQRIKPLARGTIRSGVIGEIGSFGGLFRLNDVKYVNNDGEEVTYTDPVLVQGTDGVGTKLKIAKAMNVWDTIGIDLVAMCVNDVLCNGAEPLAFLDYIACGHLDIAKAAMIVKGVSIGCRESTCALLGGETAEMPSMYEPGEYDVAGYCVGVVEYDKILPKMNEIHEGDIVIGLPSSGVHSNGFSLVNKILEATGTSLFELAPFSDGGKNFGNELLTPTKIYVADVLPLLRKGNARALAHITGGGLLENIPRVLPKEKNLGVQLDAITWKIPEVFGWLAAKGNINEFEMLRTFNCGIGMVIILPRGDIDWQQIPDAKLIGNVVAREASEPLVQVKNFANALKKVSEPWTTEKVVSISYKQSGVDICAGDSLVDNIKPLAKATQRDGVLGSIGSFGGLFRIKDLKKTYEDPVLGKV
jgi:phosphoribosylamine--glycine ligase / phosphoribosylglycinamide formyltransferase / phosphoribosylformylglycinamidine cyclo-ligase